MNESKLLSPNGIVKASALCLLMSAFSVNAAFAVPVLDREVMVIQQRRLQSLCQHSRVKRLVV